MLCNHPVSHTGGHHWMTYFHYWRSHRRRCHWDWSQLCEEELLNFHASEVWLENWIVFEHNCEWLCHRIHFNIATVEAIECIFFSSWLQLSHTYTHTHFVNMSTYLLQVFHRRRQVGKSPQSPLTQQWFPLQYQQWPQETNQVELWSQVVNA